MSRAQDGRVTASFVTISLSCHTTTSSGPEAESVGSQTQASSFQALRHICLSEAR